jgi:hypothetical protein
MTQPKVNAAEEVAYQPVERSRAHNMRFHAPRMRFYVLNMRFYAPIMRFYSLNMRAVDLPGRGRHSGLAGSFS